MKRILLLASILFFFQVSTQAQLFRFGVKGGVSSSKFSVDKTMLQDIQTTQGVRDILIEQGESKLGLHFGVFGRVQITGLFIQPELLFTQTRGEFVVNEVDPSNTQQTIESIAEQKFNKFDIPVMIGWKFGPARVGLGPVASVMLSEKDGLMDKINNLSDETVESGLNKAVFGYQVGVGLDILKFATLDLKYEGNLSKLGESITIGDQNFAFDQRNPQFIVSLGIFF